MNSRSLVPPRLTSSDRWDLTLVGLAAAAIILLLLWPSIDISLGGDQYVFLARRIAAGKLDVDNLPAGYGDYVSWHGHKYLPFGPFPALMLVPLLPLLNAGMPLVLVGYLLTVVNVFVLYRVLGLAGVEGERKYWATLLYFGGTPYLSVALVGISTYYAHVVVTTFLLLAVYEVLGKRRLLLAGFYLGLASGSRLTALFALPLFIWLVKRESSGISTSDLDAPLLSARQSGANRATDIAMFLGGLTVPLCFVLLYNLVRFGSVTETGFGMSLLYTNVLEDARRVGMFSAAHIPKNLFMMFLQGPLPFGGENAPVLRFPYIEPSRWGMGLFFTSPALIYAFRASRKDTLVQACWLATLSTMIPLLTYYGIGYVQFGYRYALDFMPFLILLTAMGFPEPMTTRARALVLVSVLVNIWGAITLAVWL